MSALNSQCLGGKSFNKPIWLADHSLHSKPPRRSISMTSFWICVAVFMSDAPDKQSTFRLLESKRVFDSFVIHYLTGQELFVHDKPKMQHQRLQSSFCNLPFLLQDLSSVQSDGNHDLVGSLDDTSWRCQQKTLWHVNKSALKYQASPPVSHKTVIQRAPCNRFRWSIEHHSGLGGRTWFSYYTVLRHVTNVHCLYIARNSLCMIQIKVLLDDFTIFFFRFWITCQMPFYLIETLDSLSTAFCQTAITSEWKRPLN